MYTVLAHEKLSFGTPWVVSFYVFKREWSKSAFFSLLFMYPLWFEKTRLYTFCKRYLRPEESLRSLLIRPDPPPLPVPCPADRHHYPLWCIRLTGRTSEPYTGCGPIGTRERVTYTHKTLVYLPCTVDPSHRETSTPTCEPTYRGEGHQGSIPSPRQD